MHTRCTILHMKKQLTNKEQQLLHKIRQSITANPFSRQRAVADSRISDLAPDTKPEKLLNAAIQVAKKSGQNFIRSNRADVNLFDGRDRQLVDGLFLFIIFHSYRDQFDCHIRQQIKAGDEPVHLDFHARIIKELSGFGYSRQEVDRYIAVFFQMRRAFYFINTSLPGKSLCMQHLRCQLWNNIFTHDIGLYVDLLWNRMEDFSTLLTGKTGTGKGVAAAAIGRSGFIPFDRKQKRFKESFTRAFLAVNLSQIPDLLIESELFGHARGSFTGAVKDHDGVFARSSRHGAVFLDEIGELSTRTQVKLLRILQERSFSPVGSSRTLHFSGRVIGATNRDIDRLRQQKKFRDDFYFRLCSDTITIPSLRRRIKEDGGELELLTDHLLTRIVGRQQPELLQQILDTLHTSLPQEYAWQGNVRELEQSIRRILLSGSYKPGTNSCRSNQSNTIIRDLDQGNWSMAQLTRWYCNHLYGKYGTYQQVAKKTGLDRRTVKKYLNS